MKRSMSAYKKVIPPDLNVSDIRGQFRLAILELAVPLTPFPGLKTELVLHWHEHAQGDEAGECRLHVVAQLAVVGAQVVDEQVGEVSPRGPDSDVGPASRGSLPIRKMRPQFVARAGPPFPDLETVQ